MYYRSDWPEAALPSAISNTHVSMPCRQDSDWIHESRTGVFLLQWVFSNDLFESRLYDFPIWSFHVEATWDAGRPLQQQDMNDAIESSIGQLLSLPRWRPSYLFSRVVRSEPLYRALLGYGFHQVEERCIYRTLIGNIAEQRAEANESILCTSLDKIAREQHGSLHEQMISLSEQAFKEKGHSRHFTDPFLSDRTPGCAYIVAAMQLNFERLSPSSFLLALMKDSLLCGFSVFGKKSGLDLETFTQLLSAVRKDYQGRQVYQSMTRLLIASLPPNAVLLNATHAGNAKMQVAYKRSGRMHLADTVALRRIVQ
jgi:hypothetical protein